MVGALYSSPELPVNLFDIDFPNPIGVAAGMDKNGEAVPSWQSIGYGFCEIGGVTLHEQPGNPKPRMFRASKENALINRMGFNNIGAKALKKQLQFWKDKLTELYAKHTGQSVDILRADMDRDNFMSAERAVEYGLADRIIESR